MCRGCVVESAYEPLAIVCLSSHRVYTMRNAVYAFLHTVAYTTVRVRCLRIYQTIACTINATYVGLTALTMQLDVEYDTHTRKQKTKNTNDNNKTAAIAAAVFER